MASDGVVDEAGVRGFLGYLFFGTIWKITGGNAEVLENAGLKEKAIRKLLKTKGRFCTKQRVIRDVKMGSLWCVEMEIIARVPPLRSPTPINRAEE